MAERLDADDGETSGVDLLALSNRTPRELCADVTKAIIVARILDPGAPLPHFGRFEVREVLGAGGFGSVFLAWDPHLAREVALKVCPRDPTQRTTMLLEEARSAGRLSHPNIVTVYEAITAGDRLVLAMEYVGGGTLENYAVKRAPDSLQALLQIFAAIARGLAFAHDKGVIHGDLKPENVLLHGGGRPSIADFGLARTTGEPKSTDGALGTIAYVAPEQFDGKIGDPRSDQWAFFVMLYQCVVGVLPMLFERDGKLPRSNRKLFRVVRAWARRPTLQFRRPIPEALREVMEVGLSPDPNDRFADMHEVATALERMFVRGLEAGAVVEPGAAEPDEFVPAPVSPGGVDDEVSPNPDSSVDSPWASYLMGVFLFAAGVLVTLSYAQVPWPWRSEPPQHAQRPADGAESTSQHQCVHDGLPFKPDPGVQVVCRALWANPGDYQGVDSLWSEVAESREQRAGSPTDWVMLASDTTALAQTYLAVAESLGDKTVASRDQADELRAMAKQFAQAAESWLPNANSKETAEAASQVDSVIVNIIDLVKALDRTVRVRDSP